MAATEKDATNIRIRRMTRSDIDAVVALGQSGVTYRDLAAFDLGGSLDMSFVAEAGDRVIGFILARVQYLMIPFIEVCLVHSIAVADEYRKKGIGARLVSELQSHCMAEGIHTIRALVEQHDTRTRLFVEYLGFHRSNIANYDKTIET
jgi:ribosomal protein S18 acetylase RimI-like enzyme